jgi:hypothetical protein
MQASELITKLQEIQDEYSILMRTLTIEERLSKRPQRLMDLVHEKNVTEENLIKHSQSKPIAEDHLSTLHPELYKALIKRGLIVHFNKIEVPKLVLTDIKEVLMRFDSPENIFKLKEELLLTIISEYRTDQLYGKSRIIQFNPSDFSPIKSRYTILIMKYIRQNLRDLVRSMFPIKYDRNTFNAFFDKQIENTNKIQNLHLAMQYMLSNFVKHVSGKKIELHRKKNLTNKEILKRINFNY